MLSSLRRVPSNPGCGHRDTVACRSSPTCLSQQTRNRVAHRHSTQSQLQPQDTGPYRKTHNSVVSVLCCVRRFFVCWNRSVVSHVSLCACLVLTPAGVVTHSAAAASRVRSTTPASVRCAERWVRGYEMNQMGDCLADLARPQTWMPEFKDNGNKGRQSAAHDNGTHSGQAP